MSDNSDVSGDGVSGVTGAGVSGVIGDGVSGGTGDAVGSGVAGAGVVSGPGEGGSGSPKTEQKSVLTMDGILKRRPYKSKERTEGAVLPCDGWV